MREHFSGKTSNEEKFELVVVVQCRQIKKWTSSIFIRYYCTAHLYHVLKRLYRITETFLCIIVCCSLLQNSLNKQCAKFRGPLFHNYLADSDETLHNMTS
ncbi:hypothetical protein T10_1761 [Trichinella papuae]|uniref:Uncharacterized protein n=1 Tax=Trichinella papuae TaxID=268474 RepID=A0A0V1M2X6_9BILA|nr:hypothetical protein T10_1761 [Trichinella papuae]